MPAGSIVVDLLMKTGSFETDTARAGKSLKKLQKDAEDVGRKVGLAFTAGAVGLAYLVKSSIDAADHLNDLSKSTGVSVETLGGIGFAASQAGSSLDGAADSIGKLNQTLAKAAAGSTEASAALKALGVDAIDPLTGQTISVDKALVQMADTLSKAGDSPEKFRAAAGALGKQYKELLPLLQDGGQALLDNIAYYQRFGGVTTETAEKADKFNDELGKIKLLSGAFGRFLASELLTPLTGIAEAFLAAKEKGDGFKGAATGIKDVLVGIATAASFVVNSLGAMSARLDGLVRKAQTINITPSDGFFGGVGVIKDLVKRREQIGKEFDQINQDTAEGVAGYQKSYDEFTKLLNEGGNTPTANKTGRIPGIPDPAAAGEAEASLKRLLEGQLKAIHSFAEQQKDALAFANRFLEGEYQDGIVSLENFFGDQKNIRDRALKVQLEEQDKIIAAEAAFAKRTSNPASRIDAENKIADAVEAKTRLIVKSGQEEQLALQQNARDVKALRDAFESVNAQVLDLHESFAAAAAIKFDLQFDALSKTFSANGNQAGQDAIATLRAAAIAQAAFQKASLDSGRTLEELARQEERLALSVQTGALTSLEALSKEGEARRKMIPIIEAQVAALQAIANASPDNKNLQNQADNARLALDKLKASADPLAESLNKTFGEDFNSALDDFVTGTKTASDAFKSFAKSVLNDILKMGSKSITESIFGGSGGAGGFLSDLFKSSGGGGSAGGLVGALLKGFGGSSVTATSALPTGSGLGIDVSGHGFSAAKDSQQASEDLAGAQQALIGTTAEQTAAAAASAEGLTSAASALTSFSTTTTLAGNALALFQALTSSSSASSAVGFLGKVAGLFSGTGGGYSAPTGYASAAGISGGRADGGPVMAGKTYRIGERGPELLTMGNQGGNVTPNHMLGGTTQHINVNVQGAPNQSRDSAMQQGAAIGLGIQKALARNT